MTKSVANGGDDVVMPTGSPSPAAPATRFGPHEPVLDIALLSIQAGFVAFMVIGGALVLIAWAGGSEVLAWVLAAVLLVGAGVFVVAARVVVRAVKRGQLWAVVVACAAQGLWLLPAAWAGDIEVRGGRADGA